MGFDLASFLLCGQHDNDTDVLLPDDVPKVLVKLVSFIDDVRGNENLH